MKKKQLIAFASAMALAVTSLAGCGKSGESAQKEAVSEAKGTRMPSFRLEWLMMIIHT